MWSIQWSESRTLHWWQAVRFKLTHMVLKTLVHSMPKKLIVYKCSTAYSAMLYRHTQVVDMGVCRIIRASLRRITCWCLQQTLAPFLIIHCWSLGHQMRRSSELHNTIWKNWLHHSNGTCVVLSPCPTQTATRDVVAHSLLLTLQLRAELRAQGQATRTPTTGAGTIHSRWPQTCRPTWKPSWKLCCSCPSLPWTQALLRAMPHLQQFAQAYLDPSTWRLFGHWRQLLLADVPAQTVVRPCAMFYVKVMCTTMDVGLLETLGHSSR